MNGSPADEDDMTFHTDLLTIGEFGRATGLTPKALRLYDDLGLLVPAEVDRFTGYRRYAPAQLDRARLVAALRGIGMPLSRVAQVVDLPARSAAAELTSYAREVAAQAAHTRAQVTALVADLAQRPEEETPMSTTTGPVRVSDTGLRHEQGARDDQLDAVHAADAVFVVADGFGDDPSAAADLLGAFVAGLPDVVTGTADLDAAMATTAAIAAEVRPGSGTTLTAVALGERDLYVAHIGDSRAYRVREGCLERLTRDHNVVQSLVDEGRLTPEEARLHDRRHILHRALAPETPPLADLGVHPVEPGDRIVLTTDGVHARISGPVLADLLVADGSAQSVADAVVDAVVEAGADDNLSVIVVDL